MPTLVLFQSFTEPEFALFERVLRPGSTFVDVGGGIGTYSVTAAKQLNGIVHVFEPTPENAEAIRHNARTNGVGERIEVHQLALSDSVGYSTIVSGHNTFTNNVGEVSSDPSQTEDPVAVTTLDAFCADHGLDHIDVLKVDVAGYEPEVIAGAARMLSEQRIDVITLELSLEFLPTYRTLQDHGYGCFYTDDGALLPVANLDPLTLIEQRPSVFTVNVVAVSDAAYPAVRERTSMRT